MKNEQTHTPTPRDIWNQSQASLQNLWSDCPELYQQVARAVNMHEELLTQLKKAVECLHGLNAFDLKPMKQAIAKAEGK